MPRQQRVSGAPRKVAAPFARRLVIMVKEPVMGRVKTRLAREIGMVSATAFYRANSACVIARLARDARWRTELSVAPDAGIRSRAWAASLTRKAQGHGDLGQRMQHILDRARPGPVIVVGTDIPGIRPAHIAHAFRELGRHDAVLGPTPDGGFWLVGNRRTPRTLRMFADVRWSSANALADTERNLAGRFCARATTLSDVDCNASLAVNRVAIGRRILPLTAGFTGCGENALSRN